LKKRICTDFVSRVFSKWTSKNFSLQKLIRITHKSFLSEIAEMLGAYRLKRTPNLLEKFSKNVWEKPLKIFIHRNANYGVTPFQYHISITIGDYCKWSFIHGIFVDIALQPGRTLCAFKLSGNTVTVSRFLVPSLISFSLGNLLFKYVRRTYLFS
jgi:hypothetical protein